MTEQLPSAEAGQLEQSGGGRLSRRALLLVATAAAIGVGGGAAVALLHRSTPAVGESAPVGGAAVRWAAGARPAPDFTLRDQQGRPVSLAALRGRPVILTFIDPLCRNLCPLEAKVLTQVESELAPGERPAILAVSTNPWGNARSTLELDISKWRLSPSWRWAVGARSRLTGVWKEYEIQVVATEKRIAGVTVHEIAHTEAAYLIDASGNERALYLWPFYANDVERGIRSIAGGASS